MPNLIDIVKTALSLPTAVTHSEAMDIFNGVTGRGAGQFGPRLKEWLDSNPTIFPEQTISEYTDHMHDRGVDVILTGLQSGIRIGFQIKSDNDLRNREFTRELKAQITDALAWDNSLIVLIMACKPTPENQLKYIWLQNEIGRWPGGRIVFLDPTRAGGLWRAFDNPMPNINTLNISWPVFFTAIGQSELAPLYLDTWPDLTPDSRFQKPNEYTNIIESVRTNPVTLVIGPPAVGKTFTALQILREGYLQGKKVSWIAPRSFELTDGPIANPIGHPDMKRRIEMLSRYLGLHPPRAPLDANEFIAVHLEPDSLIYFEDPFGKTDSEFGVSLHTYRFFDLSHFVASIKEGMPRAGCHILITSREGLFERWQAEVISRGLAPFDIPIFQIGSGSYDIKQRFNLVSQLASARNFENVDTIAEIIAAKTEVPYEAELIIQELSNEVTPEDVVSFIDMKHGDLQLRIKSNIQAETDGEQLFLLLVGALCTGGHGRNNFPGWYNNLYLALGLPGLAQDELRIALSRYRPYVTRLGPNNDLSRFHLEPVHSTILEAIGAYLSSNSQAFIDEAVKAIPKIKSKSGSLYTHGIIILYSLSLFNEITSNQEDIAVNVLFEHNGLGYTEAYKLARLWSHFSRDFKDKLFNYLKDPNSLMGSDTVAQLLSSGVNGEDAWSMLRILLKHPGIGVRRFQMFGNPWRYLFDNIYEIPEDLKDTINNMAENSPVLLAWGLCDHIYERWDKTPEEWRSIFTDTRVLNNPDIQEKLLISLVRNWHNIPETQRELFKHQASHVDYRIRAAAGIAALVYCEVDPVMESIYMEHSHDPDIRVPLEIIDQGLGDEQHDQIFADAVFERADKVGAASILSSILYRSNSWDDSEWVWQLARRCLEKGEDLSRAIVTFVTLSHTYGESSDSSK